MKKIRVYGNASITVSCVVYLKDNEELDEDVIYDLANERFSGIEAYVGNGGYDKLIGVEGDEETISDDGYLDWDDYEVEDEHCEDDEEGD